MVRLASVAALQKPRTCDQSIKITGATRDPSTKVGCAASLVPIGQLVVVYPGQGGVKNVLLFAAEGLVALLPRSPPMRTAKAPLPLIMSFYCGQCG